MNKMSARAHPNLIDKFKIQMSQATGRDQTAISYTTGEMRLLWSKQSMPHNRMNSVCSNKSIN